MIPEVNQCDRDRDPEEDYEYASKNKKTLSSLPRAWIRRAVAAEAENAKLRAKLDCQNKSLGDMGAY